VIEDMKFIKNDEAVSPVIGVILMVAITVILAAVIAAFVFGMAGNISKSKVVAVTATKTSPSQINIMNQGGQDQPGLVELNATAMGATTADVPTSCLPSEVKKVGNRCVLSPADVGSTIQMTTTGSWAGRTEVIVVGKFSDGTNQVLLDTYL
jgi:archaeal type IV pilus assembly protein PilA